MHGNDVSLYQLNKLLVFTDNLKNDRKNSVTCDLVLKLLRASQSQCGQETLLKSVV